MNGLSPSCVGSHGFLPSDDTRPDGLVVHSSGALSDLSQPQPLRSRARAGIKAVFQSPQPLRKADHSSFLISFSLDIHAPRSDHGRKQNPSEATRQSQCRL